MTRVYINYPKPNISVYADPNSPQIGKHNKINQRYITINSNTLDIELSRFSNNHYRFAANTALNDMRLDIDLENSDIEMEVLQLIQKLIGKRFKPLAPTRTNIVIV